jgi:hypothetical protein
VSAALPVGVGDGGGEQPHATMAQWHAAIDQLVHRRSIREVMRKSPCAVAKAWRDA